MRALLIDTAGPVVGAAAWDGAREVGVASMRLASGADGWLTPVVARLLAEAGGLDRIGVTVGPGAFTGIRVGVATALGLAVSLGVDVVCLSSLALRAAAVPGHARVLAVLDARKGRVYAGLFDTRGAVPIALGEERDLPPEALAEQARAIVVGEGAAVYRNLLERGGHEIVAQAEASPVGHGKRLVVEGTLSAAGLVGLRYLREPDARPPAV